MNKTGPKESNAISPGLQKLLLVCGALVLCALVYVFVSLQGSAQPVVVAVATPSPRPSPTATAKPGVREAKVLGALETTALVLGEYDRDTRRVDVSLPSKEREDVLCQGVLELALREGYVRGFTLELPALAPPPKAKPQTAYEQGEYAGKLLRYELDLELQRDLMHIVLSEVLAALDPEGEVPPGAALLWENEVENLLEAGQSYSEQAGPFTFLAVRTRTGKLQVSLSK